MLWAGEMEGPELDLWPKTEAHFLSLKRPLVFHPPRLSAMSHVAQWSSVDGQSLLQPPLPMENRRLNLS